MKVFCRICMKQEEASLRHFLEGWAYSIVFFRPAYFCDKCQDVLDRLVRNIERRTALERIIAGQGALHLVTAVGLRIAAEVVRAREQDRLRQEFRDAFLLD